MRAKGGFTLIELMVVVAVMGLLTAILVPVLSRSKEMAVRAICASNLKQQGMLIGIYASANGDMLPMFSGPVSSGLTYNKKPVLNTSGNWLHDEPIDFGNALLALSPDGGMAGGNPAGRIFYCPARGNALADELWGDTVYQVGGYRVMGYAYFNDRGAESMTEDTHQVALDAASRYSPTSQTSRGAVGAVTYHRQLLATENPTQTELALDEITSVWNAPPTDFAKQLTFGGASPVQDYPGTSHVIGTYNAGANVLAFDGHVEWRTLNPGTVSKPGYYVTLDMMGRTVNDGISDAIQGVYFWVPSPK